MASTIILSDNGVSSGSAGLKSTAGNDGVLILQTTTSGGTATNAVYVDNNQNIGMGITPSTNNSGKTFELGSAVGNAVNGQGTNDLELFSNTYYNSGHKFAGTGYANRLDLGAGSGVFRVLTSTASGSAGGSVTWNTSLSINTNGALALLNGATNASGVGITFPAAQSASSDANTLDDYEEGTWTPTDASGAGLTFTSINAKYTKVGNVVTVQAQLTYPTTANTNGAAITGLPFTGALQGGGSFYSGGAAGPIYVGTTIFYFAQNTGASVNNNTLSTRAISFTATYLV